MLTGGTDVHLVLDDLRNSEMDGQQAEDALHGVGITVNRNAVPFDPRPPMVTSGLRIGTPALATRGFGDVEFAEAAALIALTLQGGAGTEAPCKALRAARSRSPSPDDRASRAETTLPEVSTVKVTLGVPSARLERAALG